MNIYITTILEPKPLQFNIKALKINDHKELVSVIVERRPLWKDSTVDFLNKGIFLIFEMRTYSVLI